MVYQYWQRNKKRLQTHCLLCKIPLKHHRSDYFGLCCQCDEAIIRNHLCCQRCQMPLTSIQASCGACLNQSLHFDSCITPLVYNHSLAPLIIALKKQQQMTALECLYSLSWKAVQASLSQCDLLLPLPMHRKRNGLRGNDHAILLMKRLATSLSISTDINILFRIKENLQQKNLNATQRKKNLHQAFAVRDDIAGLRIAVIDDVITTGATMNEAAKTLKQAGAAEVHAIALARTPK